MSSVVALGNFDGLHRGHMAVLNNALSMAERLSAKPFALVFKEHPSSVLSGGEAVCLFTGETRAAAFKKTGVTLCLLDFEKLKDMEPLEFFEEIIIKRMGAVGVCCGFNYSFGKNGVGDAKMLKALCERSNIEFSAAEPVDFEGAPVSSTRIRSALEEGRVDLANRMLGRPYSFRLPVVDGDKRGRHLGAPTINQEFDSHLVVPKFGVYMSAVKVGDKSFLAVTNIGVRPTFYDDAVPTIETHILDFEGDLYGKFVEVSLLRFLRPEIKFDTFIHLETQIMNDERKVRKLFEDARNRKTPASDN